MKIFAANNINFCKRLTTKEKIANTPKPTIRDTSEYFLYVDEKMQSIPYIETIIYPSTIDKRLLLANNVKHTFLNYAKSFSAPELKCYDIDFLYKPTELEPIINNLLDAKNILNKEEKRILKEKLIGAFTVEEVIKMQEEDQINNVAIENNLKFLKDLTKEENTEILNKISPRTLVKILENTFWSYGDFTLFLNELKTIGLLEELEEDDFFKNKKIIHETLTKLKYTKHDKSVDMVDKRLSENRSIF